MPAVYGRFWAIIRATADICFLAIGPQQLDPGRAQFLERECWTTSRTDPATFTVTLIPVACRVRKALRPGCSLKYRTLGRKPGG
jgi:hypothetical protein